MGKQKSRTVYAEFHRKPLDGWELADPVFPGETWKVQIEKGVELSKEKFQQFQEELYGHYEFLYENGGDMYFDDEGQCAHSLLALMPHPSQWNRRVCFHWLCANRRRLWPH